MGKIKTVYKNLPLKKALTISIVGSLFTAFLGTMAILLATRPSYYALAADNPENPALRWHDFFAVSTVGIYVCIIIIAGSYTFYRLKLSVPLKALTEGIEQIAIDNLDFSVQYNAEDELGILCRSFERMKNELQSNYKRIWRMTEERRKLNAAFAHDLRTPLTVLQGYTDFLEEYIPFPEKEDAKLLETNRIMAYYIKRLADYVEVMNKIPKLEDTPVKIQTVPIDSFMKMLDDNIKLTAKEYGKDISVINKTELQEVRGDISLIFRVLENVMRNACRYSKNKVSVRLYEQNDLLSFEIIDDGAGFRPEALEQALNPFYTSGQSESPHFGLGLNICKILCEKHGGSISISNTPNLGARVQFSFLLEK
ncbi:HAMP domain-containing sensor histidine kinase [Lachnospiraceae bacterium 47-T17]